MRNILLRSANAKPYFFLNEINKKDLPAMYSTAFWCLFVVLLKTSKRQSNTKMQWNTLQVNLFY